jgi:hypothetical protein
MNNCRVKERRLVRCAEADAECCAPTKSVVGGIFSKGGRVGG